MKLKDVNINAEDLLNFLNNHICTEEASNVPNGFQVKFLYKLQLSQLTSFIMDQFDNQVENAGDNVIIVGETKCGKIIQGEKKVNEVTFIIKGKNFLEVLDRVEGKERVIPTTTPDQRSIHPSL